MTAGPAARIPRERLIVGDGLRAAAALSVVAYHTTQWIGNRRYGGVFTPAYGLTAAHVFKALLYGLAIFFVLSGYLVFRGFAHSLVLGIRRPSVSRYAAHRLLRIVPAFWVALTLTFVLEGVNGSDLGGVLAMFGFAQIYDLSPAFNLMPQAWTLNIEVVFYLALPFLAWAAAIVTRRIPTPAWRAAFLTTVLVAAGAASSVWMIGNNPLPWEGLPPVYLIAFVPGMIAAVAEPVMRGTLPTWVGRVLAPLILLAGLALFVRLALIPPIMTGWRTVLGALSAGAILWAALLRQWVLAKGWRVLDNRPMRWLGERLYGIYLFHFLVLLEIWPLVDGIESPWPLAIAFTLLTTAGTVVIAALSWRFIEVPALRLRPRRRRLAVDFEPDSGGRAVDHAPA